MPLPSSLRPFFWNCRFEELDTEKHKYAIIETLLEYGNIEAWRWMVRSFMKDEIVPVLKKTRILSPESRSFWSLYFHIPLQDDATYRNSTWRHRADTGKTR